ncbi:MAG: hypothetical protein KA715_10670 [Xanthomonadaceae bacterium]|nr:hypothetical protein [Xanthomonadaceae bacterium]
MNEVSWEVKSALFYSLWNVVSLHRTEENIKRSPNFEFIHYHILNSENNTITTFEKNWFSWLLNTPSVSDELFAFATDYFTNQVTSSLNVLELIKQQKVYQSDLIQSILIQKKRISESWNTSFANSVVKSLLEWTLQLNDPRLFNASFDLIFPLMLKYNINGYDSLAIKKLSLDHESLESILKKYSEYVIADVSNLLKQSVFITPLSPKHLAEFLSKVDSWGLSVYKKNIMEIAQKSFLEHKSNMRISTKKEYEERFPEFKESIITQVSEYISQPSTEKLSFSVADLLRNQNEINAKLEDNLNRKIESNELSTNENWLQIINRHPLSKRYDATLRILKKNDGSADRVSKIIAKLEPVDGIRDAILDFINSSELMNANRSEFSQDQVKAMIPDSKFNLYFPHLFSSTFSRGAIRTKFCIAIRTSRSSRLRRAWLSEKLDDQEVRDDPPEIMGYRPALTFAHVTSQLGDQLRGGALTKTTPTRQARGLIVQGSYEKQGFTLMDTVTNRGGMQVEEEIPSFTRALENSLRTGILSHDTSFVRRWFVYNWGVSSNQSLVETIRNRAETIASSERSFWNLRVEIHNFPNHDVLNRVKRFRQTESLSTETAQLIDQIISEISSLLGVTSTVSSTIKNVIDSMPCSDQSKQELGNIIGDFSSYSPLEQLAVIEKMRKQWKEIKTKSTSSEKNIEYYQGDREIADFALTLSTQIIEKMGSARNSKDLKNINNIARSILSLMSNEDLIQHELELKYIKNLESVSTDTKLRISEKVDFITKILRNAIDQTYYSLNREFEKQDQLTAKIAIRRDDLVAQPSYFVDTVMRSTSVFALSKLADKLSEMSGDEKGTTHQINEQVFQSFIDIYNPGKTIGTLKINPDPQTLNQDDIAVFDQLPAQMLPTSGIITIGVGARLSHIQLLAKALKIPSIKVSANYKEALQKLDGKKIFFSTDSKGSVTLNEVKDNDSIDITQTQNTIEIPFPSHAFSQPLSFENASTHKELIAGPKGMNLAKLFTSPKMKGHTVDGVINPFDMFDAYARTIGIWDWVRALRYIHLKNEFLVSELTEKIRNAIRSNPIPSMDAILSAIEQLKDRTHHTGGYFIRSDTNVEDLPNFNGAGLNESIANVSLKPEAFNEAIRQVWSSPFEERSIRWRSAALQNPRIIHAEPSSLIMPTVNAKISGVMLSQGGQISANWGIGSVVESESPVEEISLSGSQPIIYSYSVSETKPIPNDQGGLKLVPVEPGTTILSTENIAELKRLSQVVESVLGKQPNGWDIEWAIDQSDRVIILQARPNM